MSALQKKGVPARPLVLGPYEKAASRLTVRDLSILMPPPGIGAERMFSSVYWLGRPWGDLALAEHLAAYPRVLKRVLKRQKCEDAVRIDFPGTTERRHLRDVMHPVLMLDKATGSWEVRWATWIGAERAALFTAPLRRPPR